MGSVDHLRYIFTHLDGELAADIEENSPGGLKMLCNLYSLQLQLEKGTWITVEKTELVIKKYSLIFFFLVLLMTPWFYVNYSDKKYLKI